MRQPHLIAVAKFIRDLFAYDQSTFAPDPTLAAEYEALIKFDREDKPESDFNTSYIVINGSGIEEKQSSGATFDGEAEIMNYSEAMKQGVTIEFYGDDAYTNARMLSLKNVSQAAADLKRALGLSISHVSRMTDVKQILGSAHGNRVHVEMNVNYCPSIDVETLRIDTAEFEFLEDK